MGRTNTSPGDLVSGMPFAPGASPWMPGSGPGTGVGTPTGMGPTGVGDPFVPVSQASTFRPAVGLTSVISNFPKNQNICLGNVDVALLTAHKAGDAVHAQVKAT